MVVGLMCIVIDKKKCVKICMLKSVNNTSQFINMIIIFNSMVDFEKYLSDIILLIEYNY